MVGGGDDGWIGWTGRRSREIRWKKSRRNLPVSGIVGGVMLLNRFDRNPRIFETTRCGEPCPPNSDPLIFENRAESGAAPPLPPGAAFPSDDATVLPLNWFLFFSGLFFEFSVNLPLISHSLHLGNALFSQKFSDFIFSIFCCLQI